MNKMWRCTGSTLRSSQPEEQGVYMMLRAYGKELWEFQKVGGRGPGTLVRGQCDQGCGLGVQQLVLA